jgi:hypothetical protein
MGLDTLAIALGVILVAAAVLTIYVCVRTDQSV